MSTDGEYKVMLKVEVHQQVVDLLVSDRRHDEYLPIGSIEKLVQADPRVLDDMCDVFRASLLAELGYEEPGDGKCGAPPRRVPKASLPDDPLAGPAWWLTRRDKERARRAPATASRAPQAKRRRSR